MPRIAPATKYPERRIIVFAGAETDYAMNALKRQGASGIMVSFQRLRSKKDQDKWHNTKVPIMDTWPQWRYLDSGAYNLLRRMKKKSDTKAIAESIAAKGKIIDESELMSLYRDYESYLRVHLDKWDFVFEMDVHPLTIRRRDGSLQPGHIFAENARKRLISIAGDKLIPVWQWAMDHWPYTYFDQMTEQFKYIGMSASQLPVMRVIKEVQMLTDRAVERGVKIHFLGTSNVKFLTSINAISSDATTWLSGSKYGRVSPDGSRITDHELRPRYSGDGKKVNWFPNKDLARSVRTATRIQDEGGDLELLASSYEARLDLMIAEYLKIEKTLKIKVPIRRGGLLTHHG